MLSHASSDGVSKNWGELLTTFQRQVQEGRIITFDECKLLKVDHLSFQDFLPSRNVKMSFLTYWHYGAAK